MEDLHEQIGDAFEKYFEGLITRGECLQDIAYNLNLSAANYRAELEIKQGDIVAELCCLEF